MITGIFIGCALLTTAIAVHDLRHVVYRQEGYFYTVIAAGLWAFVIWRLAG